MLVAMVLFGCKQPSKQSAPWVTTGTHKVWRDADYLDYMDEHGFGCGNVSRSNNGFVYSATVINWNGGVSLQADYNNLYDAMKFVERWCKP